MKSLFDIFQKTKNTLCKYDYYIYTSKSVIHLTNSELKIPHLMGLQYVGRQNRFTGDFGVYAIKKMLLAEGIQADDKLLREIIKVNLKFGKYHLLQELRELSSMLAKCENKREEALVKSVDKLIKEAQRQNEM